MVNAHFAASPLEKRRTYLFGWIQAIINLTGWIFVWIPWFGALMIWASYIHSIYLGIGICVYSRFNKDHPRRRVNEIDDDLTVGPLKCCCGCGIEFCARCCKTDFLSLNTVHLPWGISWLFFILSWTQPGSSQMLSSFFMSDLKRAKASYDEGSRLLAVVMVGVSLFWIPYVWMWLIPIAMTLT